MITNKQWELIDEKYGKLLTTICSKISGDEAIANFDDNLQDLRIATIDAVSGFSKKEGLPFSEFWGSLGFHKYMKTCLWNMKNKKGARISKRYAINKNTVDVTEYSEILAADSHDSASVSFDSFFDEVRGNFDVPQQRAIDIISNNPSLIKPSGKVNVRKLSKDLGCCAAKTRKLLDSIRSRLTLEL